MKKIIALLFIIICSGIFITLKLLALGDPNSHFNQTTRFVLGKYPALRSILGLHDDGDARAWYFEGSGPIAVEVAAARSANLDDAALTEFAQEIKKYTGRDAVIYNSVSLPDATLSTQDVDGVVKKMRAQAVPNEPIFFIIYAQDYQRQGDEIAKTLDEDAMIMSNKRLREVIVSYPRAEKDFVESTFLHEFGHQLGLDHNTFSGCIMNENIEKPTAAEQFFGDFTPTDFCPQEQQQIQDIKKSLN